MFKCIDDVPVVAPMNSGWVSKFFAAYVAVCERANIKLAPFDAEDDKAFIGRSKGVMLGVLFDTEKMSWGFSEAKSANFVHFIHKSLFADSISWDELLSLTGKCIYIADLFVAGKYHKEEMLRLKSSYSDSPLGTRIPVTLKLKRDLSFWLLVAKASKYGLPISMRTPYPPINSLVYWTDAAGPSEKSENGLGCIRLEDDIYDLPVFLLYLKWTPAIQKKEVPVSIAALELLGPLLSVICDIEHIANKSVLFRIDNVGSTKIWNKGYSTSDPISSTIVKAIFDIAVAVNAVVFCNHVPRRSTPGAILADDFSKGSWVRGLVSVLGPSAIIDGWKFPSIPISILKWLSNPVPDDGLGAKILEDMSAAKNPPKLLGYNVIPYEIQFNK